ncbi:MAG: tetratricopeptide repeat protein [Bryobacteraceae bacterium]|nr:tetratricopeptide repeat protein [Bryobacteraceae bacterium]
MTRTPLLLVLLAVSGAAADPGWEALDSAYRLLRERQYDSAVTAFRRAVALSPGRPDIRKDLAYTLLKIGEREAARDEFAEVVRLQPDDQHVAREYAFLCFETRQQAEARRTFQRLGAAGDAEAAAVFARIDAELLSGIQRWQRAVELTPDSYSAHEELSGLAERRDDFALAAKHYEVAWKLRPGERRFLLDLGRVWLRQGDSARSFAALLAASRGAESRTAELAKELLPTRYPWVSEFRDALAFDPENHALHRELAFLFLAMNRAAEAEGEFREVVQRDSKDAWALAQLGFLLMARNEPAEALPLLDRALSQADDELKDRIRSALKLPRELRSRPDVRRQDTLAEARVLAQKSFDLGYMKDAARYLRIQHENDPVDFEVILKLGWTANMLKQDREAFEWFRLARRSSDPKISAEAKKAWEALRPQFATTRTSVWAYPMYSSRWHDLFSWAQYKTEFHPNARVYPYISARFAGDVRRTAPGLAAGGYLSESAIIPAVGLTTKVRGGTRAWIEAGMAFQYLRQGTASPIRPDLRGGVSTARSFGRGLAGAEGGIFGESSADLLFISRFERDTILYAQNRGGYTLRSVGPLKAQFVWNLNVTADVRRLSWANTFESGPGLRLKLTALPQPVVFSLDILSGRYTVPDGTRPPTYTDVRFGIWYAYSY